MDYLSAIAKLLTEEQENFWRFKFRSRDLSDQENYSRAVWDDEASRSMWNRYVYPFTDDLADLVESKDRVVADSRTIMDNGAMLFCNCTEVYRLSNHIEDLMRESDREHTTGTTCCDKSANLMSIVLDNAPPIDKRYADEKIHRHRYNSLYAMRRNIY